MKIDEEDSFYPQQVDACTGRRRDTIDWSYWANFSVVRCDDACLLSLGLDPRAVYLRQMPRAWRERFENRFEIARSHVTNGSLPSYITDEDRNADRGIGTGVSLAEFRAWGESLAAPLSFPEGFPESLQLAPSLCGGPDSDDRPLGTKERRSLLRVIRALGEISKLPERGAVVAVVQQLQELGFDSPREQTVRGIIKEARDLEPDSV